MIMEIDGEEIFVDRVEIHARRDYLDVTTNHRCREYADLGTSDCDIVFSGMIDGERKTVTISVNGPSGDGEADNALVYRIAEKALKTTHAIALDVARRAVLNDVKDAIFGGGKG